MNVLLRPLFSVLHLAGPHGVLITLPLAFTSADIYHQVFWGALWGVMLCLPLHKFIRGFWARAFLLGAFCSVVMRLCCMLVANGQLDMHVSNRIAHRLDSHNFTNALARDVSSRHQAVLHVTVLELVPICSCVQVYHQRLWPSVLSFLWLCQVQAFSASAWVGVLRSSHTLQTASAGVSQHTSGWRRAVRSSTLMFLTAALWRKHRLGNDVRADRAGMYAYMSFSTCHVCTKWCL